MWDMTGDGISCATTHDINRLESTASYTHDGESAQPFEGRKADMWAGFGVSHCLRNVEADSCQITS